MTGIDKLINLLELAPITLTESEAIRIIAVLEAGQAMRDAFYVNEENTVQVKYWKLDEAGLDWDDALRKKELEL